MFAPFAARELSGVVGATLARLPAGACPVWTASNHDVGRFPTRWCGGDERKARLALLVLATLPGTTVLYYGDEIGMTDVTVPRELRRDDDVARPGPAGTAAGTGPGRRCSGTPRASGGFTAAGVTPWLPVGDAAARNVADQRDDPGSVLRFCRSLLALRRAEFGGRIAPYELLPAARGLWAYRAGGLTSRPTSPISPPPCPARPARSCSAPRTAHRSPAEQPGAGPRARAVAGRRGQRPAVTSTGRISRPSSLARSELTSDGPNPCSASHPGAPP